MGEHFLWLPIALLALFGAHALRPPRIKTILKLSNVLAFSGGIFAVVLITDFLSEAFDVGRKSAVVREEKYLPSSLQDAPVLLLVGSSYTRNGVDPVIVNAIWAEEGIQTRMMTRAAGGASRLEQWVFVEDVVRALGRMPERVLFEVHPYWDRAPLYGLKNSMSGRAINQIRNSTLKWALLSVYHETDFPSRSASYPEGFAAVSLIVKHYLAGRLNYALSQNLERDLSRRTRSSFVPLKYPKATADLEKIETNLESVVREFAQSAEVTMPNNIWRDDYFADVAERIHQAGGTFVGFYAPPSSAAKNRMYARAFCAWQAQKYCLNANTLELARLYPVSSWYDETHLLAVGAEQYSRWLAYRLIADGVVQ